MNATELATFKSEMFALWKPFKYKPFSEVCEDSFYLPTGKFRCRPAQRKILDAMTDPLVEKIVVQKSARFGYTQCVLFCLGYYSHFDPSAILVVQPTLSDANSFSKQEIQDLIADNPYLKSTLDGDLILKKLFPGGSLTLVGSNSAAGFRRLTIRLLIIDECSAFGPNPDGDAIELAGKRTETHTDRKIIIGSTPGLKGSCRITEEYDDSNQQEYHMPCPECNFYHPFLWENFVLTGEDVYHECPQCKMHQLNYHKFEMMEKGEWVEKNPGHLTQGFKVWTAYSSDKNASWEHIRIAHNKAKSDTKLMRVFSNTWLGEPFDDNAGEQIDWQDFMENRISSETSPGFVPDDAKYLFAGVDIQGNRFEKTVIAYSSPNKWHLVDHIVINDIDPWGQEAWTHLADSLTSEFHTESGDKSFRISRAAIDSGYCTGNVYEFCRRHRSLCIPIKGSSVLDRDIMTRPRKLDYDSKKSITLFTIGIHKQKLETVSQCADPEQSSFPALPPEYFQGLFSERLISRVVNGANVEKFIKITKFNEEFDCLNYALFAAASNNILRANFD